MDIKSETVGEGRATPIPASSQAAIVNDGTVRTERQVQTLLINTANAQIIAQIKQRATIDASILADAPDSVLAPMQASLDSESVEPYALFGDLDDDFSKAASPWMCACIYSRLRHSLAKAPLGTCVPRRSSPLRCP